MSTPSYDDIPKKRLGEALTAARTMVGLSEREAADAIGISPRRLRQWESGRKAPSTDHADAIADAYGLDLAGNLAPRVPIEFDEVRGGVVIAGHVVRYIPGVTDNDDFLEEYVAVVRKLRRLAPDAPVHLRATDIQVLATVLDLTDEDLDARIAYWTGMAADSVIGTRERLVLAAVVVGVIGGATVGGFMDAAPASADADDGPGVVLDLDDDLEPDTDIGNATVEHNTGIVSFVEFESDTGGSIELDFGDLDLGDGLDLDFGDGLDLDLDDAGDTTDTGAPEGTDATAADDAAPAPVAEPAPAPSAPADATPEIADATPAEAAPPAPPAADPPSDTTGTDLSPQADPLDEPVGLGLEPVGDTGEAEPTEGGDVAGTPTVDDWINDGLIDGEDLAVVDMLELVEDDGEAELVQTVLGPDAELDGADDGADNAGDPGDETDPDDGAEPDEPEATQAPEGQTWNFDGTREWVRQNLDNGWVDGWQGDNVALTGTELWQASSGDTSIDLNGDGPGWFGRTVETVEGGTYEISFDMSGNPHGQRGMKSLDLSAGDEVASFSFDTSEISRNDMRWERVTMTFTADADSTWVSFDSTTPGSVGAVIDNISITQIS